jgi:ribose 5-phosphate isomerase B
MRKIFVGSDHAGITLKNQIRDHLKEKGHEVIDLGADQKVSCHYPDFA